MKSIPSDDPVCEKLEKSSQSIEDRIGNLLIYDNISDYVSLSLTDTHISLANKYL